MFLLSGFSWILVPSSPMPNLLLWDIQICNLMMIYGMGLFIITTDYMSLDIKNVLPTLQGSNSLAWKKDWTSTLTCSEDKRHLLVPCFPLRLPMYIGRHTCISLHYLNHCGKDSYYFPHRVFQMEKVSIDCMQNYDCSKSIFESSQDFPLFFFFE